MSKNCLPRYSTCVSATYFEKAPTEHNFEMHLIKWGNLYASRGTFQTLRQGKYTLNKNLNNIIRLSVTKTESLEKVATVDI